MYKIKRAVELTGVNAGTLRAWEQRYGVGSPKRTDAGYRLYDDEAISEIRAMQGLVASGWSHTEAAAEVVRRRAVAAEAQPDAPADERLTAAFLNATRRLDDESLNAVLDEAFSRGSFEYIVDGWLMVTLRRLGEEWVAGRMDIPSEHFASNAIMRRLGNVFDSAASTSGRDKVLVGTPAGSFHEMGSLALAAAARRRGLAVVYLGCNVPTEAWVDAARRHHASAVVISVVMPQDADTARDTVDALARECPEVLVAIGGSSGHRVANAGLVLTGGIAESAKALADAVSAKLVSDHSRAH